MQNFTYIHNFQIINLQLITTTRTPIFFTLPDSMFDIHNISNPKNPKHLYFENDLFDDMPYTQKVLNLFYNKIKANRCPICINNNIKKSYNMI